MNRKLSAALSASVAVTLLAGGAQALRLDTRNIGRSVGAYNITACSDGRVYTLGADGTIRVNATPASSAVFANVGRVVNPGDLFCHGNVLHHLDSRGNVLKAANTAALTLPSVASGVIADAREVESSNILALVIPVPIAYKLQRGTNQLSSSGNLAAWTVKDTPGGANHIAVGGGFVDSRVYALNNDDSLWINEGTGCGGYWKRIGVLANADTFTSSVQNRLFVLNDDDSVRQVDIVTERRTFTANSAQVGAALGAVLAGSTVRIDSPTGNFSPGANLRAAGVPASNFAVPTIGVEVFPFGRIDVDIDELNLNSWTARASGSNLVLRMGFETAGTEIQTRGAVHPWYDLVGPAGELHFGVINGACSMPELSIVDAVFEGSLQATDAGGAILQPFLPGIQADGENALLTAGEIIFGSNQTQRGLQNALVQAANQLDLLEDGRPAAPAWLNIVPGTVRVRGGNLELTVER